jgi:hypothetical protein
MHKQVRCGCPAAAVRLCCRCGTVVLQLRYGCIAVAGACAPVLLACCACDSGTACVFLTQGLHLWNATLVIVRGLRGDLVGGQSARQGDAQKA